MNLNVIDLFAGAGGFSCGLEQAGFNIKVANEYINAFCNTHRANHKDTIMVEGDITDPLIKDEIIKNGKKHNCNIIVGGPPCQAYSTAGKRDPFDKRGKLFLDYFEIVKNIDPEICIMENVKGLLTIKHFPENISDDLKNKIRKKELSKKELDKLKISVLDTIKSKFKALGYNIEHKLLNSANFGVPQKRERVILIASKKNNIQYPIETHSNKDKVNTKKWTTVKNAIDDLKDMNEDIDFSHIFRKYKDKTTVQRIKDTPCGQSYTGYSEANFKCYPDKPSNTVKENHGAVFVHYEKNRHMTPRELARLQSFPDSYIFKGPKGKIFTQLGNAVPPQLAKNIGLAIIEMMKS